MGEHRTTGYVHRPTAVGRAVTSSVAVVLLATALVVVAPGPARAHGGSNDASNFTSDVVRLASVSDRTRLAPGLLWQVRANDALLEVRNLGDHPVTVLGYDDEPYLRIGPDGVFENRMSPATYLNRSRYGRTPVPADVTPDAAPVWRRIGTGSGHAWHDHRIHWMAEALPPPVAADPSRPRTVMDWTVPFTVGGRAFVVHGRLRWVPSPTWWPWAVGGVLVCLGPVLGAAAVAHHRRRVVLRTGAVVVALVSVADVVRAVDDVVAVPASATADAVSVLTTAAFVCCGLAGAAAGWRAGAAGATLLAIGGLVLAIAVGLPHVPVLRSSQVATMLPLWFARAVVVANLAMGVVAVVVLWLSGQIQAWVDLSSLPPAEETAPRVPG